MRKFINIVEGRNVAPFRTLKSVEKFANKLHVSLDVSEDNSSIILSWIEGLLNRVFAEKGSGARVMQALCSYADFAKKEIILEVLGGDKWLMNYYKQFGFEIDPEDEKLVNSGYWNTPNGEKEPGPSMGRIPR